MAAELVGALPRCMQLTQLSFAAGRPAVGWASACGQRGWLHCSASQQEPLAALCAALGASLEAAGGSGSSLHGTGVGTGAPHIAAPWPHGCTAQVLCPAASLPVLITAVTQDAATAAEPAQLLGAHVCLGRSPMDAAPLVPDLLAALAAAPVRQVQAADAAAPLPWQLSRSSAAELARGPGMLVVGLEAQQRRGVLWDFARALADDLGASVWAIGSDTATGSVAAACSRCMHILPLCACA